MAFNVSTARTKSFIDYWIYAPSAIAFTLLLSSLFSSSLANTLVDKKVLVEEEEAVKVETLDLQPSKLGALRVDVQSSFNNNFRYDDWIVYEIQLRDRNGEIIASAIDEDWKESGTWREGGESGRWQESNLTGGIDLRAVEGEQIDVFIQLLERAETIGINPTPVSFDVKIKNGVVDNRPLWWGTLASSIVAVTTLSLIPSSGKKAVGAKIRDSDVQGRGLVGGKDNLVRAMIQVRFDERPPVKARLKLSIDNDYGERACNYSQTFPVRIHRKDGRVTGGSIKLKLFFVIEPYGSYRFRVDVTPDKSVEFTSLDVRQASKTLGEVAVTTITNK